MSSASRVIQGVLGNRCPHCMNAKVFGPFFGMARKCPACGYVYEREPGYFMGAMVFSYILGAASTVPTVVIGIVVMEGPLLPVIAIACLQVVILSPLLFKYSRLIWMHLDYRSDPP